MIPLKENLIPFLEVVVLLSRWKMEHCPSLSPPCSPSLPLDYSSSIDDVPGLSLLYHRRQQALSIARLAI